MSSPGGSSIGSSLHQVSPKERVYLLTTDELDYTYFLSFLCLNFM